MLQRYPVEKLHNQERMAILLPDLVDGADIGMIECRRRLRLPLEARQGLIVFDDFIGQKIQGDKSVEGYVLGLIDDTHAATTKLLEDPVVRDGLADHQRIGFRIASSYGRAIPQSTNDSSGMRGCIRKA